MTTMKLLVLAIAVAVVIAAPLSSSSVNLATFDGAKGTTFKWKAQNDPVMGGASTSTFSIAEGVGTFNGTCRVVSFLHAPGFAKATTSAGWLSTDTFNDASSFVKGHLTLEVRSSTPSYTGFKAEIGAKGLPHSHHSSSGSYKAMFNVTGTDWQTVKIPLSDFSYDWSDFTGRCDTQDPNGGVQHHCCSAAHPEVCPTANALAEITAVAVWAEGVAGDFHLEVKSIGASM